MKLITASACGFMIDETELKRDRKVRPFSMFEPTEVPATSLRKNQSSDDLVRDAQVKQNALLKSLQGKKKSAFKSVYFQQEYSRHLICYFSPLISPGCS